MGCRWLFVSLVVAFGCGPEAGPSRSGDDAGGSGVDLTDGAPATDGSSSTAGDEDTTGGGCEEICLVDFPCSDGGDCIDRTTIERFMTLDCKPAIEQNIVEGCDPECCSGAVCVQGGTEQCPRGTVCIDTGHDASCEPEENACNGVDLLCEDGFACEYGSNICPESSDVLGLCVPQPEDCSAEENASPECGCDGVEYPSACARREAGVGRSLGPC